jgi:hypothetical protein
LAFFESQRGLPFTGRLGYGVIETKIYQKYLSKDKYQLAATINNKT